MEREKGVYGAVCSKSRSFCKQTPADHALVLAVHTQTDRLSQDENEAKRGFGKGQKVSLDTRVSSVL